MSFKLLSVLSIALPLSCASQNSTTTKLSEFDEYWLTGKGEVSSYALEQARYGELHQGTAVLIFVTEDISKSKQVKLDNPAKNASDAVKVMKLNLNKKFTTGIYDYSLMQSVFTPINRTKYPHTFKVSMTAQDWCGQIFSQINLQTYKYRFQLFSYFEKEADHELILEKALLEDELWNLIRFNPQNLPTGSIQIIPSTLTARLRHNALTIEDAEAKLSAHATNPAWSSYEVNFVDSKRKLTIHFQNAFPYTIEAWEETYLDNGKELTTKATRKKTLQLEYWEKHFNENANLRKDLGLE